MTRPNRKEIDPDVVGAKVGCQIALQIPATYVSRLPPTYTQFWAFLSHLNTLAGPTIMLLYPLYASVCAIESPSKVDDEQWLAYWILYSFLTLTEMVAEPILYWIPIWYQLKVAFVAWLALPQFRGAAFIYERFVREQLRKYKAKAGGGKVESNSPNKYKEKFVSFVTPKKGEQEVC